MVYTTVATFVALSMGVPRKAHRFGLAIVTRRPGLGQGRDFPHEDPPLQDAAGHSDVSQPLEVALLFVVVVLGFFF